MRCTFIQRLWQSEEGQTTTEYILILAVVVMIAMKFKSSYSSQIGKAMDATFRQVDEAAGGMN